jgi:hypothetical protein
MQLRSDPKMKWEGFSNCHRCRQNDAALVTNSTSALSERKLATRRYWHTCAPGPSDSLTLPANRGSFAHTTSVAVVSSL